ncbi:ABC transporter permease [Streptomyces viridochromogenes]|uniref:ABC transporter permease n=1 Tax=Streptomyces viridochromogenes TaxID=1938 RepID=A0A0J8CDM2_STRVR|nr:ABC transporter permease [Streptomyces viridochromogenes]KMS75985.1 ABC transporter permease [Streptomyces viridochromogenes]KOG07563.1 ABC transporter permease [Streptomyces viridochromogenes]KOG12704.1 ABC transporter permease [Streptomyces viridochromogenes]
MLIFLSRRLVSSVIALVGVVVVVFFLGRLTGSPAHLYLPQGASQEMADNFNRTHGFNDPLWQQFIRFVGDVAHLDFGTSIWQQRPALTAVTSVFPQTLLLAVVAMTLSIAVAAVLGCLAAARRFGPVDKLITFGSLACASIPDFWFALVGVLFLAVHLGVVPTSGQSDLSSWILPVATLMLAPVGVLTQVVRGAMIEALGSGYVQSARARGLAHRRLVYRHALRNAALPIISVAGDRAAGLVNGAVIVGTVFAWPGIGTVMVDAVLNRDFAVIQAGVFVIGLGIVLLNVLVDLTYAVADPRVRVS